MSAHHIIISDVKIKVKITVVTEYDYMNSIT